MSFWIIGISTAVTLAGTYVSVQGQREAAKNAENAAAYNAKVQRDQAVAENEVATENARRKAREANRYVARQRAELAASGLSMEGTPLVVLGDTLGALELEIMDLSYESSLRSQNLLHGANMTTWEGQTTANALRTEATATAIKGVGSAIGGFASASGQTGSKQSSTKTSNGYLGQQ